MQIKNIKSVESDHVYDISVAGSESYILENGVISHNSGLKYAASTIIFLSKKKDKDGKEVIGNIIHCKLVKNRFARENVMVDCQLSYTKGLNRYYGLLDLAEEGGIFPKEKTRYMVNGVLTWGKTINENPEKYYTPEVLEKIDEFAKIKFGYGNAGVEEDFPLEDPADVDFEDDDDRSHLSQHLNPSNLE